MVQHLSSVCLSYAVADFRGMPGKIVWAVNREVASLGEDTLPALAELI